MIALDKTVRDITMRLNLIAPEQFTDSIAARHKLLRLSDLNIVDSAELSVVLVRGVELMQSYRPGESHQFCEQLSSELQFRWARLSPRPVRVYWATKRAVNLFGGEMRGRLTQLDAASHDLGCSATALNLFAKNDLYRDAWVSETAFLDVHGQAKPDAALADASGVKCLIEFCGQYTAERLDRLCTLADRTNLPLLFFTVSLT